jgi:hypothetical protein
MVNEVLVSYIRSNLGKYPESELKKEFLAKGYSEQDFNEAVSAAGMFQNKKNYLVPTLAGFAVALILIVNIILSFFDFFFFLSTPFVILILCLGTIFSAGFVMLSYETNSKLLRIGAFTKIAISFVAILGVILSLSGFDIMTGAAILESEAVDIYENVSGVFYFILFGFFVYLVAGYLSSFAFLRLGEGYKFSNLSGILGLCFYGILTLVLVYFFAILIYPAFLLLLLGINIASVIIFVSLIYASCIFVESLLLFYHNGR